MTTPAVRRSRSAARAPIGTTASPAGQPTLVERLFPAGGATPEADLAHGPLPPVLRPDATQSVLDITEFFGETSGGIRTYLLEKAAYVEARPHLRQSLLVPAARDAITQGDGVRCYRAYGPEWPRQKPYRLLFAARAARRIVEHERPSVIEVGSPALVPWIADRAAREHEVPLVYFYHSNFPRVFSAFPEREGGFKRRLSRLAWRYARHIDRKFDVTVATSQFSADELHAAGIDRVVRVPLGADLGMFNPARRAHRADTRARHGLPVDAPVVGFVGRFAREKELDVLLEAWRTVEARSDAWLVLIGDGPRRPMLESLATGRRVRFIPFQATRPGLADLHAALDVYVAPSSIETFGLSSLESLASGTPLLAADRGGVREQVLNSGAGRLFSAGVAASLADELLALLGDDLAALGARGRAYAEREHDWAHVFDRLFAVYREVSVR
ncbi:MAG: glycosyltransferase [Gemmatimonadetes bacterium]|nr:glycosyltransferase [Gemmatimonadota bacterium]